MQKYDGRVIFQSHDDDGIIEVVEQDQVRSLHFGSDSRQSSVHLNRSDDLYLAYSRAMMSWMLFADMPQRVLMIGLGGGCMPRFLLGLNEQLHITVVEQRKAVTAVARKYFFLPFSSRLKIVTADGGQYVRNAAHQEKSFDLMFVDAFGHDAMSSSISGSAFFDACRQLLHSKGMLIINLWDTDQFMFEQIALTISESFHEQILFLPVKSKGNIIVLAFAATKSKLSFKQLQQHASLLEAQSGIEFGEFVRNLKKYNPYILDTLKNL